MPPADARSKLLDAARTLIRTQGFAGTSVDVLCRAAGVTKGDFFHHFDSKEALGVAAAQMWSAQTGALLANGGEESRCGWLTDRWGVSRQITLAAMIRVLMRDDRAAVQRAREAMFTMRKIELSEIERAYYG